MLMPWVLKFQMKSFYNFLIYITIKQVYNKRKTSDKFGDILSSHF